MHGGVFFIVLLLHYTLVGRGVDGERVNGVLHGRVELRGRSERRADVDKVEWFKYSNLSRKLIFLFINSSTFTCTEPCKNIEFNLQNMSLILLHLKREDEGIYEERTTLKNNTVIVYNFTLSLLFASNITVSSSPGSLTLKCETQGEFELLRWFRNGVLLPDGGRFSLSENKTLTVTNPTRADDGMYTCQVSNENGKSEVHINVSGEIPDENPFQTFPLNILLPCGFSLIGVLVLFIISICICKHYVS